MARAYFIVGLDIGTENIKILGIKKERKEEKPEILGITQSPSAGIRKGIVIKPEETSRSIRQAVESFYTLTGRKFDSVFVNLSGSHIFLTPSRGVVVVSRADQKISHEEVERVLQAAQTFSLPSNKEILDVIPKQFIIDGEKGIREPIGLHGIRLEAEIIALGGFSPYIKNLTQAVLGSGLQISDIFISPLAASRAVLGQKQKELGVAVLDIGAGATGMAVFEEGDLVHTAVFPVGAANITNDIAIGLRTDIETAERIKIEFGSCFYKKGKRKEKIKKVDQEESLSFSLKMLADIIEARVSEVFDLTNKELKKISRQGKLPGGIILTGGGAKLPNLMEFAKKEFKLFCHLGYPSGISGIEKDPSLALVTGLVLKGMDGEEEKVGPVFREGLFSKLKGIFRFFLP